jgi:Fe2+ transport system protein B
MGIFKHKKADEEAEGPLHFFDDYFREELRNKGRQFFEKAISVNAARFQKDLDATVAQVDADLQEHITNQLDRTIIQVNDELTRQIDDQFVEYGKAMKESQDKALISLDQREQALQQQHEKLSEKLQQNIASQEAMLVKVYQENMQRITAMQEAQSLAVQMLNQSVQALQQQHEQFSQMLQKSVVNQEEMLLKSFEENMAKIVEHYLLGALGDQYDMKAQLPSIIKQLEANKKEITEDMML